jgi:hypothetical protein
MLGSSTVNTNTGFECLPDVSILIKIKRTTGMNLIKTTRPHGSFVGELWFGRLIQISI